MLYILSSVVLVVVVHDVFLSDSARAKLGFRKKSNFDLESAFGYIFAGVCFSGLLYALYMFARIIIKVTMSI